MGRNKYRKRQINSKMQVDRYKDRQRFVDGKVQIERYFDIVKFKKLSFILFDLDLYKKTSYLNK